ncbi:MAG: hypothetical protein EXS35_07880 [Pedosphaera sp.]|nr:hypothetical protein [Pedosphaera sp.]
MGNNPFISHRMFVAALKGDGHAQNENNSASHSEGGEAAVALPAKLSAQQLEALMARHWLDFPFARGLEQSAS